LLTDNGLHTKFTWHVLYQQPMESDDDVSDLSKHHQTGWNL